MSLIILIGLMINSNNYNIFLIWYYLLCFNSYIMSSDLKYFIEIDDNYYLWY